MLFSDLPEECIGSITWYLVNNAHDYAKFVRAVVFPSKQMSLIVVIHADWLPLAPDCVQQFGPA
jgi:hypothetical protein